MEHGSAAGESLPWLMTYLYHVTCFPRWLQSHHSVNVTVFKKFYQHCFHEIINEDIFSGSEVYIHCVSIWTLNCLNIIKTLRVAFHKLSMKPVPLAGLV